MSPGRLGLLRAQREAFRREFSFADVLRVAEGARATVYTVIPGVRLIGLEKGEEREKQRVFRNVFEESFPMPPTPYGTASFNSMLEHMLRVTPQQQHALYELSKLTGGWTDFLEEPSQAAQVYGRILSDINRRYVLGFYPTNKERDGKRRRVQIEVRGHPEYTVWGRKSYYAPGP
jgi:hypothetical protein